MRQLYCPHCRSKVFFEDQRCQHCNTAIAFDPHGQTMQEAASVTPCANRTLIGCNWPAEPGEGFCQSCHLTRIIPNLGSDRNVMLWKRVEAAKRRLVYDLDRMKPTALFVNTSRAELVEPGALREALGRGRPARAAVDVYEREPFPVDPLIACPAALCTPHLGYVERDSHEFAFGNAFQQVAAYVAGAPIHVVNPAAMSLHRAPQRR